MSRNTLWHALFLSLLAHAGLAAAQQTPASAPPPPKLERIEEGSDVPVTITPGGPANATKITEKREGGRVTEVEVKTGKSTYTMKPNVPAGNAQPGDGQSSAIRAPQWKVLEFDIGNKKKKDTSQEEAASTPPAAPAPVPPPPPPAKN